MRNDALISERPAPARDDAGPGLRAILDATVDGVILTDARGLVTVFNPACETIFGFSAAEIVGGSINRLMPASEQDAHDRHIARYMDTGVPGIIGAGRELLARRKNGDIFSIELSVSKIMQSGEAHFIGILRDITERRAAETARERQIEQLFVQSRLIDEQRGELETFAYALAHDFKQPIRQITTFSQLLVEDLDPALGERTREHLGFLTAAAGRLSRLVDVMTQYTLLDKPPVLVPVDLTAVVTSVLASLSSFIGECGGEVCARLGGVCVLGNEELMVQVLQNLVLNGLRYNRSRIPRVSVDAQRLDDEWIVRVTDNGIGIDPQFIQDIFKPLVRLHGATEYPGTGLGLTLARKALAAQNGQLQCERSSDAGTTFVLTIPAADVAGA
jgi:two-component system sensor kinase FixL